MSKKDKNKKLVVEATENHHPNMLNVYRNEVVPKSVPL